MSKFQESVRRFRQASEEEVAKRRKVKVTSPKPYTKPKKTTCQENLTNMVRKPTRPRVCTTKRTATPSSHNQQTKTRTTEQKTKKERTTTHTTEKKDPTNIQPHAPKIRDQQQQQRQTPPHRTADPSMPNISEQEDHPVTNKQPRNQPAAPAFRQDDVIDLCDSASEMGEEPEPDETISITPEAKEQVRTTPEPEEVHREVPTGDQVMGYMILAPADHQGQPNFTHARWTMYTRRLEQVQNPDPSVGTAGDIQNQTVTRVSITNEDDDEEATPTREWQQVEKDTADEQSPTLTTDRLPEDLWPPAIQKIVEGLKQRTDKKRIVRRTLGGVRYRIVATDKVIVRRLPPKGQKNNKQ